MTRAEYLIDLAEKKVLVLDGAMGTEIQRVALSEEDVRFGEMPPAPGCNELLNLTRSDVVFDIHLSYLKAGADIIETNTFGANAFSLAEYHLADHVYDINLAAVEIARAAVEAIEEEEEDRFAFIAGVIGPTGKSASFSPSVDDPSQRDVVFDDFVRIYTEQIEALLDGGVDLLLVETVFDTLVAKAAIVSALEVMERKGKTIPIMVSATFSDKSGRTLSGQTLEALVDTLSPYPLFSLGVNCSTGPEEMLPLIDRLAQISPFRTSAHPNAGFPDNEGNYRQSPEDMARLLLPELEKRHLNILGGCCGTRNSHIAALSMVARTARPREIPQYVPSLRSCGLEPLQSSATDLPIVVGERTNVAGSRKFARLIREGKFDQALKIARDQIDQGAAIIDICMDDPLLDPVASMVTFLRLAGAEPEIARVPFMIDSSDWTVVEAALKEVQGRAIVNSISLKEGEQQFLERASYIRRMGAAMVVMLFDEEGQADTFERKCQIAARAHHLLIGSGLCDEASIVFDPNVLAIATGIEAHDRYASDFIRAVAWIRSQFPAVSISGGISNLSFSFRGNNGLRDAMHAIFLDYAVDSGLNMAIVNPASRIDPTTVPAQAASIISHALLADGEDPSLARERLIALAMEPLHYSGAPRQIANGLEWRNLGVEERLAHALLIGDESHLAKDLQEASYMEAVAIIEGPLMEGMAHVGALFGEGKLFLPQVVRSARVMKKAVDILQPRLEGALDTPVKGAGTIVLATVKGDVHDIGKNIVSLVLKCNNFKIIDLGVMVPPEDILESAIANDADIVGLSGLITPSLSEMATVCRLFAESGSAIPIMVGGATTSEEHTALKLEPEYPRKVFHSTDASHAVSVALKLVSSKHDAYTSEVNARYHDIRRAYREGKPVEVLSLKRAEELEFTKRTCSPLPPSYGIHTLTNIPLDELLPSINWSMLAASWRVPIKSEEASELIADAKALLGFDEVKTVFEQAFRATIGIFPAKRCGANSVVVSKDGKEYQFDFLRMQIPGRDGLCRSLADYICHDEPETLGMFVATAGIGIEAMVEKFTNEGDEYRALLLTMVADRLAEAFSGYLERQLSFGWWNTKGVHTIRPAIGYPSAPDHSQKAMVFSLLETTPRIGVELTEGYAMRPASTVCGFYFAGEDCDYFTLGTIGIDQMEAYVRNSGRSIEDVERTMRVDVSTAIKEES
jgi:5-methyltetrahydrofolate--homocysteine methyltransferase